MGNQTHEDACVARPGRCAFTGCKNWVSPVQPGPLGAPGLTCVNTQCRVRTFAPHTSGSIRDKCPACYGRAGA